MIDRKVKLKSLAEEALLIQDAVNLSGIVHSFSRAMSDLYALGVTNTSERNRHPIAVMYSSKIADLTGSAEKNGMVFHKAYEDCKKLVENS